MNYKTIRYPGHCEQMRLLMNDLKLNHDRATLKRMLENAVPQTLQDVVIVYAAVTGKQDGELREENYVNKVYPQVIAGRLWSAIQVTTAAGITAVVDLVLRAPRQATSGFVAQEQFRLPDILANRFGQLLRAGRHQGYLRGRRRHRGKAGHQRKHKRSGREMNAHADSHGLARAPRARSRSMPAPGPGRRAGPSTPARHAHRRAQSGHRRAASRRCAAATVRGLRARHAVGASKRAAAWRKVPAPKRGEAVRLIGEELRAHKDALGTLVSLENGKIKAEGLGEVQEMIDIADFAVGQSRMLYGLTMHSERPQHRMYEQWHPLGVVGIISAFNFPVAVWAWNAFLAAVCGDASVWKPSPKTPLTRDRRAAALQSRHAAQRAAADLSAVHRCAAPSSRARFVDDRARRAVSFTGSTAVGRNVGERVAARLGKSLLELGGNNAIIVDEIADLDLAVPADRVRRRRHRRPALHHARAACSCTSRAPRRAREAAGHTPTARCASAIRCEAGTLMGPLIEPRAVERYRRPSMAAQRAPAATVAVRRQACSIGPGNFVEPTIVAGRATSGRSCRRETFAPILYVMPVRDRSTRRSRMQNAVPHGPVVGDLHRPLQHRRSVPVRAGQRLRHRQRQHRHLGRGDRRRVRRREGNRRRPRIGLRCLEGVHAPADQHDQLEPRAAARAGHQVQGLTAD